MPERAKIRQVKYGLWISITILVVTAFMVYVRNVQNKESAARVTHAIEVRMTLGRIHSVVSQLESAVWGYVLTGDTLFLTPYDVRLAEARQQCKLLKELVKDNLEQTRNAGDLERLLNAKLAMLENKLEDRERVATGDFVRGRIVMHAMLQKIEDMKVIEEETISEKLGGIGKASERFTVAAILGLLMAIVLIGIGSVIVIRGYAAKVVIERQLLVYQQQLSDKLEKLDISNKELEQFAYVASHDLQEPLRKIITFSERINGKFPDIQPEMRDYLDRISRAADRMRALIEDLLAYSKTAKSIPERVPVKLDSVIGIIKDNLEVQIQSRGVTFVQDRELPEVYGDRTQMVQLFQNLVSNAIKFTEPGKPPVIELSHTVVDRDELGKELIAPKHAQYYRIDLKDNGIGFDEKYLEKIFITFQRLHGRSEYEGAGIGLSICKKIVEKHDGYISAKSEPGKGSVFFVYLPKDPEQMTKMNRK